MSALAIPLRRHRPATVPLVLLALAAIAVAIGGLEHARLLHRGYAEVEVVGPLFLLNAIGSGAVILLLLADRVLLFVLGAVAICGGSLVSILISHNSRFFGFGEGGYDGSATLIVAAEAAAIVLVGLALMTGALRDADGVTA